MKKLLIFIIGLTTILLLASFTFSQIPGEFTIGNSDPTVSNFEVQRADSSFDSTAPIQSHVSDTVLRWTIDDVNGDTLTTTICIGTNPSPFINVDCNVVNFNFIPELSNTQTYNYNLDPTGTLQGIPDTINFIGSDCSAQPCIKTYYVDIFVDDGQGGSVTSLNSFELTDFLPEFVNIYLSDSAIDTGSDSCEDFLPSQNCLVNPTQGDFTSLNAKLTISDLDADCSLTSVHTAQIVLCLVDAAGIDVCDPITNADYIHSLSFSSITGNDCDFDVSIPVGDSQGIEFYKLPGFYKMYLEATSNAGTGTINFPTAPEWEYGSLPAPLFPSQVFLGDSIADGGDGIQLGLMNPGLSQATIVNQGNIILNLDWEASDPSTDGSTCTGNTVTCWDLTTFNDLQIDDDTDPSLDVSDLAVENIPETPLTVPFQPVGGLQICNVITCDSGIDETLDIYFHILPPLGLSAGTYQTDLTVTIS